jgi:moderate conductance mechanosensitive channel
MITQYRSILRLFATLVLTLGLAMPASAQTPGAGDLQHLSATLKDEHARSQLISQIDALVAAQHAGDRAADAGFLAPLSESIGAIGDGVMGALTALRDTPRIVDALATRLADSQARALWGRMGLDLLAVLAAGWLADRLASLALTPMRRAALPKPGRARLVPALLRGLMEVLPILAFAAAAWGTSLLLDLTGPLRVAALMAVMAWGALRLVLVTAEVIASPRLPQLRLLPVDDETAAYLTIWTRRLAGTGLSGWFAIEAARLLGLPHIIGLMLVKSLGLALAAMAVIFVLQNRAPVAGIIRHAGHRLDGRMRAAAERSAELWHILAGLYIGAIYLVWAIPVAGGAEFMVRATTLTAIIVTVARTIAGLTQQVIDRGFAIGQEVKDRFPRLEARANRYLPALRGAARGAITILAALAILQAWGIGTFTWMTSDTGRRILSSAISIAAVLLVALVIWEIVSSAIERYLSATDGDGHQIERSSRARTLLPLVRSALRIVMAVMVSLIVLSELGVNIAPLLAGAGVVGIAIGFGSQKLVQDVITGAFILFEDTIAVGDVVKLDAHHSGSVEAISIRAIRLRDGDGAVHTVPFSAVSTVINMSRDFATANFDIAVDPGEDPERVEAVLAEIGTALHTDSDWAKLLAGELVVLGIDRLDGGAVLIKANIRTRPLQQWAVAREFNRRLKKRFDSEGIALALPATSLRMDNTQRVTTNKKAA